MGQAVGQGHIRRRGLDVGQLDPAVGGGQPRALVLVEQGDGADEGQVLEVVPSCPRAVVGEGQLGDEGVDHQHRGQETLRVAMHLENRVALGPVSRAWATRSSALAVKVLTIRQPIRTISERASRTKPSTTTTDYELYKDSYT
jgi:hypothetical protein